MPRVETLASVTRLMWKKAPLTLGGLMPYRAQAAQKAQGLTQAAVSMMTRGEMKPQYGGIGLLPICADRCPCLLSQARTSRIK
jgi:hypothetical protein